MNKLYNISQKGDYANIKPIKSRPNNLIEKWTYISYDLEVVLIHIAENSEAKRCW